MKPLSPLIAALLLIVTLTPASADPVLPDNLAVLTPENASDIGWLAGFTVDGVTALGFSPDGGTIAYGTMWPNDNNVMLRDMNVNAESAALSEHRTPPATISYSSDGRWVISSSVAGEMLLWKRWASQKPMRRTQNACCAVYSPDGSLIALGRQNGNIALVKSSTGAQVSVLAGSALLVRHIAFSPDGARVASAGEDGTIHVWDVTTAELIATLEGHTAPVNEVAFSADGQQVVSVSLDGTARVWDIPGGDEIARLNDGGVSSPMFHVAINPAGTLAATAGLDQRVRLWDMATYERLATLGFRDSFVYAMLFNPAGTALATSSSNQRVNLWGVREVISQ